ncbi:LysR family transcriptional regulator [Photobacterium sanguinicancri]|uniref:LysR family transcriptional regulator n=1 Tax=Photobacterium sanguinicancri TaxID=875932 RepID=UPI0024801D04|nr:LysR family transcriptional regulator [Photobacterium sanguinicancri]
MNTTSLWKCFVTIARCGSIAKAAKVLRQSQSTTSRQLAMLEDELGYLLFDRPDKGKGLTISCDGKRLLPKATLAMTTIELLEEAALHQFEDQPESIRLAIPDMLPKSVGAELCSALWRKWPNLEIHIYHPSIFETYRLIQQQKVDFGIVISEPYPLTNIQVEAIGRCDFGIYTHITHPVALNKNPSFNDLIPHRFFSQMASSSGVSVLEEQRLSLNMSYTQSFEQAMQLTLKGMGCTILPQAMVKNLMPHDSRLLVELPIYAVTGLLSYAIELVNLQLYPHQNIRTTLLSELIAILDKTEY